MNTSYMLTKHTKHFGNNLGTLWQHGASEGGGIYRPKKLQTSSQGAYVQWFFPSGSKATLYIHVLIRGYSKSSICLVVPRISACKVCRAFVQWSLSPHVCTTDNSVRPSKSLNYPSNVISDPKPKLTPSTKLLTPS
jgi:hypothetical protein